MELVELTPSQAKTLTRQKWEMPGSVMSWLYDNNFKPVGSGQYSVVYKQENSNIIVKVAKEMDECFEKFVRFTKTNPSKHYPKFSNIKRVGDKGFLIFSEFLNPISSMDWKIAYAIIMTLQLERDVYDPESIKGSNLPKMYFSKALGIDINDPMLPELAVALAEEYDSFVKAWNAVKNHMRGQCAMDPGQDNIMKREDGTWVITDPVSSSMYGFVNSASN